MEPGNDQFGKWDQVRSKGMLRFVIVQGSLGWGLGSAVIFCLIMWLTSDMDIARLGPLALVAFPLGGLLWGAAMWWIMERQYARHARRHGSN